MRITNYFLPFILVIFAGGCSEGGIGGTGGVTGRGVNTSSGNANKGPYSGTASVTSRTVLDTGTLAAEFASGVMTTGVYGGFEITTESNTTQLVEVSGPYFSEINGTTGLSTTVRGVVLSGQTPANINVATHLIHLRVISLIADGMSASTAIATAEGELLLELSSLIPSPVNAITFSNLVLINAQPESVNPEGNAWLLALSSILEKSAMILDAGSGLGTEVELTSLLTTIAADLEPDGVLSSPALDSLLQARRLINPDLIHRNLLLLLDETLLGDVLIDIGEVSADAVDQYACGVFQDDIVCADLGVEESGTIEGILASVAVEDGVTVITQPLDDSIANMNLFLDTDGDGTVNSLDDDDDGDGVAESADDTPYEAVPVG